MAEVAAAGEVLLPPAVREPTPVATPVPSLTPTLYPTETPTLIPTDTPVATLPPPPPPPATPVPPTAVPPPSYPFVITEQGNRVFQSTAYHVITVYVAVVSNGNVPLGGYKVVADNGFGQHLESAPSDWHWSVTNCLDCGYIKQGNLKVELGSFADVAWSVYLTDGSGSPLSEPVVLAYSANQEQWVWDFIIFKQK